MSRFQFDDDMRIEAEEEPMFDSDGTLRMKKATITFNGHSYEAEDVRIVFDLENDTASITHSRCEFPLKWRTRNASYPDLSG